MLILEDSYNHKSSLVHLRALLINHPQEFNTHTREYTARERKVTCELYHKVTTRQTGYNPRIIENLASRKKANKRQILSLVDTLQHATKVVRPLSQECIQKQPSIVRYTTSLG